MCSISFYNLPKIIFVDENGKVVEDSSGMPKNSNFFLDLRNGNAYFSGKLKATSGLIGGFTIESDYLHAGSGSNYVAINGSGTNEDSAFAFWAGNQTATKAPFWVKKNGDVYMNSGTFKGTLNAAKIEGNLTRGNSGGWLIGCGINIGGNGTSTEDGKFRVDQSGNVYMKGSINMDGATSITWGKSSPTQVLYARTSLGTPSGEYSTFPDSNYSGWHQIYDSSDDYYASYTYNGGGSWTNAVQIRGKDGAPGRPGNTPTIDHKSVFNALTNNGAWEGLYYSAGENLYINASYIKAGTIDADVISLENSNSGFCTAEGKDAEDNTTYGAKMYGSTGSTGNYYVIVTNAGVRLQAGENNICVTSTGAYVKGSTIQTSDRRLKSAISYDISEYESFFMDLKPTKFRYNDGNSNRFHTGFISQDVEAALVKNGIDTQDFAGFVVRKLGDKESSDPEKELRYLRYTEFISLNTHMIQKAHHKIKELEDKIRILEEALN